MGTWRHQRAQRTNLQTALYYVAEGRPEKGEGVGKPPLWEASSFWNNLTNDLGAGGGRGGQFRTFFSKAVKLAEALGSRKE